MDRPSSRPQQSRFGQPLETCSTPATPIASTIFGLFPAAATTTSGSTSSSRRSKSRAIPQPRPYSAATPPRNLHSAVHAVRGFVPPRLSYAFGARNSSGLLPVRFRGGTLNERTLAFGALVHPDFLPPFAPDICNGWALDPACELQR